MTDHWPQPARAHKFSIALPSEPAPTNAARGPSTWMLDCLRAAALSGNCRTLIGKMGSLIHSVAVARASIDPWTSTKYFLSSMYSAPALTPSSRTSP